VESVRAHVAQEVAPVLDGLTHAGRPPLCFAQRRPALASVRARESFQSETYPHGTANEGRTPSNGEPKAAHERLEAGERNVLGAHADHDDVEDIAARTLQLTRGLVGDESGGAEAADS
jgi:hypothetical protein